MVYTGVKKQTSWHFIRNILASLVGAFAVMLFFSNSVAFANAPTLSLVGTGDSNTVQVTVYGDPNASVLFYYSEPGVGSQIITLGTTSSSGYLSTTISSATYGIVSGSSVYVSTGGISGPISSNAIWPTVTTGLSSVTLSQTGIVLSIGQSSTITATNNVSNSLYISNNSNPSIATINLNGNLITVTGTAIGSTTATICLAGNSSTCPSLYITVQNNGTTNSGLVISFNQQYPTISLGQSTNINIYGGSGSYYISSNTTPSVVQASISGSSVILSGLAGGSSSITICSTSGGCSILSPTVSSVATGGTVVFSQSSVSLTAGQTSSINMSGTGGYYISSNTNSSIASTSINGTTLAIYGENAGSTNITVCENTGQCATEYVYVSGTTTTTQFPATGSSSYLTLSSTNPALSIGQAATIYISGGQGSGYYTIPYNSNANVVRTSISGNMLTLTGAQNGYAVVVVCDGYTDCAPLTASVGMASVPPVTIITAPSSPGIPSTTIYIFNSYLTYGSRGNDVLQLQRRLTDEGVYAGPITGTYGIATQTAVKRYQRLHHISQTGSVGPQTRDSLNNG